MSILETVGFAILGAGMVADYHCQAIAANAELGARLVAVGYYNPTRFAEISTKFGVPCVNQEELLADPTVDVVCICTPSGQHAAQTIAAAGAGKHVLVEKPMALSLADAEARRWMTDYLCTCIEQYKLDVLRIDFNIDPLPYWRPNPSSSPHSLHR